MGFFDFLHKKRGARASRAASAGQVRLSVEGLEERVVPYSVSGNAWPNAQLVTISFVPDGTIVGTNGNGYIYSNLFATFNQKFGSPATWQNAVLKAAQQWAAQTNVNFTVVPDDGSAIGSGNYQQGAGNFGDIRVSGYNFGNTNLGQAFMPPPINNYSLAGDFQFNTGRSFNIGSNVDLQTVAEHEFGHALGLYHSGYSSAVMFQNYTTIKSVVTNDDINGIRTIYSNGQPRTPDSFDGGSGTESLLGGVLSTLGVNGLVNNLLNQLGLGGLLGGLLGGGGLNDNSFGNAAPLTSLLDPTSLSTAVTGLDVTTPGDADFYSLTVPQNTSGTFTVTAQSSGISLLDPQLTVYAADQQTVLGSATGIGELGSTLTLNIPNVTPGQVLYVVVSGANTAPNSSFDTGAYGLSLDFGDPNAAPAVPLPNTQLANGNPQSSGGGQALKKEIAESLVNTFTTGAQVTQGPQQVAVAPDGSYVAVWASQGQDGDGWGVYGQRFSPGGLPLGGEFQVNTTTAGDQSNPAVAMNADGSFTVVWQSQGQDGDGWGVYGQRFDASGNAAGGEFQVNTTTAGDQQKPSVAGDGQGNFVVAWQSQGQDGSGWGIYAQRFDVSGNRVGGEFQVNTTTAGDQQNVQVAMNASGQSVVVWQSYGQDGAGWGVYGQRFDASGNAVGGEFQVNTTTAGDQVDPAVGLSASGTFVVTWSSQGQDGDGWGVYGQRFFSTGAPNGQEFLVNVTTAGDQQSSSVAMDSSGNFLVAWQSQAPDGTATVFGRQFNAMTGAATGGEIQLNSTPAGSHVHPSWAANDAGNAIVVWSGNGLGDDSGVFQQQFDVSAGNDLSDLSSDTFSAGLGDSVVGPVAPVVMSLDQFGPHPVADATTAFVQGLYHNTLGREADPTGLANWVGMLNSGALTRTQVTQGFWNSPEHRVLEVTSFYGTYLHRMPGPDELAGWVRAMASGMGEEDVAVAFLTSPEYTALHPDAGAFVAGLYQDVLSRGADLSGLSGWQGALHAGASRAEVARAVVTSGEARQMALDAYYAAYFQRAADPAGAAAWLQALNGGRASFGSIAVTFLAGDEYFADAEAAVG